MGKIISGLEKSPQSADYGRFLTILHQQTIALDRKPGVVEDLNDSPCMSSVREIRDPGLTEEVPDPSIRPVQALLEGLEEEFNKLIRTQVLGHPKASVELKPSGNSPFGSGKTPSSKGIPQLPEKSASPGKSDVPLQFGELFVPGSSRVLAKTTSRSGPPPSSVKLQKKIVAPFNAREGT